MRKNWDSVLALALWIALLIVAFATRKHTAVIAFNTLLGSAVFFTIVPDYLRRVKKIRRRTTVPVNLPDGPTTTGSYPEGEGSDDESR